ncbi:unnamed protein product [marine sediment metagenome]|uniref:Uncharacterized protein n=1 Tax=marine sediment metagenome TaxID=412755 RepID=X1HU08_9ZZZZ
MTSPGEKRKMTEFNQSRQSLSSFLDFNHELFDDHITSRQVKREWIKQGYTEQLSLYGVVRDDELDSRKYKRIEVLSNKPYDRRLIETLYYYFMGFIPLEYYSIWIYDHARDSISIVWGC